MGLIGKLFASVVVIGIAYVLYAILNPPVVELPKVADGWFGRKAVKTGQAIPKDSVAINKYVVNISDSVLADLKRSLELSRFVEPIDGTQFNYGFNGNYLRQVVEYWKTKYDWRQQESELNKYNQYLTQIEGIDIHYVHVKPVKPAKTIVPLMVIHGWPGSYLEYYKSVPLLIEPRDGIAFELIIPSIPGYGFSEAPHQQGFDTIATARVFVKLMNRLGHSKFFAHGGDWGGIIVQMLAIFHPQNIRGIHTTFVPTFGNFRGTALIKYLTAMVAPSLIFDSPENDYRKAFPLSEKFAFLMRESGYFHIQATKPDTAGAVLVNSPVGLASYILEKFSTWTDPKNVNKLDGGLTEKFTLDELITNVMIYWLSGNVASSMRYYKENAIKVMLEMNLDQIPVTVPAAVADFPHEMSRIPKAFAQFRYKDLVQYTEMPRGGHFAAFEEPTLVCNDIRSFVRTVIDRPLVNDNRDSSE